MAKPVSTLVRRTAQLTVLLAATLLWSGSAAASPLTLVTFSFPLDYQYMHFGPELGTVQTYGGFHGDPLDALDGPNGSFQILSGVFDLTSGPLADIIPGEFDSWYVHDTGGFVSLTFNLELPDHSTHAGSFVAPLEGLRIRAKNEQSFGGEVQAALGHGLFDQGTAKLLGIDRKTLPSDVLLFADTLLYDYPEPHREVAAFGNMNIRAEVPEPTSIVLTAVAAFAVGLRAKRRKQFRNGRV